MTTEKILQEEVLYYENPYSQEQLSYYSSDNRNNKEIMKTIEELKRENYIIKQKLHITEEYNRQQQEINEVENCCLGLFLCCELFATFN